MTPPTIIPFTATEIGKMRQKTACDHDWKYEYLEDGNSVDEWYVCTKCTQETYDRPDPTVTRLQLNYLAILDQHEALVRALGELGVRWQMEAEGLEPPAGEWIEDAATSTQGTLERCASEMNDVLHPPGSNNPTFF